MDDMCQSISLGKDDLCQCISFGINDLCQKLSAICHQYRTAPHKFRISAGHILTNCFFATSREVRIYWKEIYNIQTPSFFYIFRCPAKADFFLVERCPLDGDFTISLPICLSCPLLAMFWPPSL